MLDTHREFLGLRMPDECREWTSRATWPCSITTVSDSPGRALRTLCTRAAEPERVCGIDDPMCLKEVCFETCDEEAIDVTAWPAIEGCEARDGCLFVGDMGVGRGSSAIEG